VGDRREGRRALNVTWVGLGCGRRTATATHAVSVYYPFALVDVIRFQEGDDHGETGETLLVFLDADGCQVTVRMTPGAIEALKKRLQSPPDSGAG
jgi:hypothetical protein